MKFGEFFELPLVALGTKRVKVYTGTDVPLLPFYLKCACIMCLFLEDSSSSYSLVLAVPPPHIFPLSGGGCGYM